MPVVTRGARELRGETELKREYCLSERKGSIKSNEMEGVQKCVAGGGGGPVRPSRWVRAFHCGVAMVRAGTSHAPGHCGAVDSSVLQSCVSADPKIS